MKKAIFPPPKPKLDSVLTPLPYDECFNTGAPISSLRIGRRKAMKYSFWRIAKRLTKLTGAKDTELLERMMGYILTQCRKELLADGEVTLPGIGVIQLTPNNKTVIKFTCDWRLHHKLNTPEINAETYLRNARIMGDYET
jgi:hypothetical protein